MRQSLAPSAYSENAFENEDADVGCFFVFKYIMPNMLGVHVPVGNLLREKNIYTQTTNSLNALFFSFQDIYILIELALSFLYIFNSVFFIRIFCGLLFMEAHN